MKKKLLSILFSSVLFVGACLTGCSGEKGEYKFANAGFEKGTLSNWTTEGKAFTERGVSFSDRSDSGEYYNYVGEFFFCGSEGALPSATGYMLSEEFKLEGNGKIGFLIGAGKNTDKCYVSVVDSKKNTEYARIANDDFDEVDMADSMHRVVLDASKGLGKNVRIKVVDNDDGSDSYNYINVDDFIINYQGEAEAVGKLYQANTYIKNNANKVNSKYRMSYHVMPEIGWCNDPNGFSYYNGKVHLFYQYNPYSAAWDTMHWGHVTSDDMIKWQYEPVALAPDTSYDSNGCFSGSAIVKDSELYLMYTGVDATNKQLQCVAVSSDGKTFEKLSRNPVINDKMLGNGMSVNDFRDPYVFYKDGKYYCLVGTRTGGYGNIALYSSDTLLGWQFVGYVMNNSDPNASNYYRLSGVYECPSFAEVDGKQILICSPQFLPSSGVEFQNIHSVVYMVGELNTSTGKFTYDKFREIDGGFDFYAAQTTTLPDGRTVMTAWMQMWDRNFPTQSDGWTGAMILPRELSYKNGKLYQAPVREIENYRQNKVEVSDVNLLGNSQSVNGIKGDTLELEVELKVDSSGKTGVKLFKGATHETLVYYDANAKTVVIDRSKSGVSISGAESIKSTRAVACEPENGIIKLRIFLDNTSCEVFINDGVATLTANVYADPEDEGIEFFSEGTATVVKAVKYDLIIK